MRSATLLAAYEKLAEQGVSEREFAETVGVPRTTLQHWRARKASLDSDPALVALFESPAGLAFLHRLVGAAHFVFGQVGPCGVDLLCSFLELAHLDAFVAGSHGSQHKVAAEMTVQIVRFGATQRKGQAGAMPRRTLVLAEDETFPEGVWLVAMDPVSGYIVLEQAAESRDADTWTAAVNAAIADLWVEVVVAAGDEASGLAAHAVQMGAQHAPDLFHVQHPLWRALVRPLQRSLEGPAAALARAAQHTRTWHSRWQAFLSGPRPPGRPPDYPRRIAEAEAAEAGVRADHEAALARKEAAYAAIRSLGSAYHPVDLATGALRDVETLAEELGAAIATLRTTAQAIRLADKGRDLIDKAARVIPKMVAHLGFCRTEWERRLAALSLPGSVHAYAQQVLIPAAYLARLAERAATVAERTTLLALRQGLLAQPEPADLALLSPYQRFLLDRTVPVCIDLFVRSTSCVEGRNGRLALWHHHKHRLSAAPLSALTVIHNYWLKRSDGSTAAERFFEVPHDDLFEWLLDHMALPLRPAVPAAPLPAAA